MVHSRIGGFCPDPARARPGSHELDASKIAAAGPHYQKGSHMALYIPGGAAGGAPSGSIGAVVFSHNRGGSYMRTRKVPTNPSSAAQVLARNRMSALTNYWYNGLTAAERQGWETYAANVPVTNRIGQQIYLTGLNWYVAMNSLRDQAAGAITWLADAPTIYNLASFDIGAITASEATQGISATYTAGSDWEDDDGALLCWATRPQNASVNFNNLPYRYASAVYGNTTTPPPSPAVFTAPFAFVAGQKLFVRINCINPDGRIGAQQKYEVVAAA